MFTDQRPLPELQDVFHITHQCGQNLGRQMVSVVKVTLEIVQFSVFLCFYLPYCDAS